MFVLFFYLALECLFTVYTQTNRALTGQTVCCMGLNQPCGKSFCTIGNHPNNGYIVFYHVCDTV